VGNKELSNSPVTFSTFVSVSPDVKLCQNAHSCAFIYLLFQASSLVRHPK